ncbi:MAG: flagellar basal body rod protein FlgB [Rhizobiales bacterium 65-79]|jgi:flagellar basal-body rod protein FlgB|nr:flagellar basal body rod protein FlgB [Hyphomicrobiales bacterium]OJU04176.1 MAG: flagellar basal body rod protein FlgB [Rhizobiales bacterium 65-79]
MQPVNLFDLAAQQARWLAVRQSVIAGNVANVNTPGYHAVDVKPFSAVLDDTQVTMKATQPGHFGATDATAEKVALRQDDSELVPSGNSVQLEDELMKAADVRRAFDLNTAIVRAFHQMFTMTTKSS